MIRFGTGGWRAIIADEFTKANVQLLCQALASMMQDEKVTDPGIIIGYDRRFLSHESAVWAAEVLAGNGIVCRLIDKEAPTPLIMFTVKRFGTAYGLAVTASHNPAIYNGVKLFTSGGRDADEAVTGRLEEYIARQQKAKIKTVSLEEGERAGLIVRTNPFNLYIDSIISSINMDAIRGRNLKIVLDPMFGVSRTSLQTILMTARCEVDVIHERRDTLFGGRLPTPNVETLNALKQFVLENKSDLGIATDGDADRLGIIDDLGQFVHPNQILVLLYYYLVSRKGWRGPCVRNLATTHLLDRIAEHFGEKCYEVPVGFKHISAKMQETGAVIGGESSGGLTVRGHIPGKDGIYAAALLVEMLAVTGDSLSAIYKNITDQFGELFMTEADFRFTEEMKSNIQQSLMVDKNLPEFTLPVDKVSWSDGCKVYFANGGWVIARFSGTEPLLRIFCEMPTLDEANLISRQLASHLGLA